MKEIIERVKKSKTNVPDWSVLVKEYDVNQHAVVTDKNVLKDVVRSDGVEKSARITYGYQKLATRRMTQMAFAIPVKREYDTQGDSVKIAQAKAIEEVYRRSRIDSLNIRRMRAYFSACEIATMWYPVEDKNNYYGFNSDYKLRCVTYSSMDERFSNLSEAQIYPVFDKYDDLIQLGIEVVVNEDGKDVIYFYLYDKDKVGVYKKEKNDWVQVDNPIAVPIGKIPLIYLLRPMPIWEDLTSNVHEIELALSRESNILRKNSAPILGVTGKLVGNQPAGSVAREVYQIDTGGKIEYITWQQQIEAFKFFIETLKKNMDEELQLPNLSMENVKSLGQIGEAARKTVLTDAHLKVGDESGALIEFFERECNIIKAYLGKMNKEWESTIDSLKVEHIITPFIQNDEMNEIEKITKATGGEPIASRETGIKALGWVSEEDVQNEIRRIQDEQDAKYMPTMFEPTE